MEEMHDKFSEIRNTKCGLTYPRYTKTKISSNYPDHYRYSQRPYLHDPYQYYPQSYDRRAYAYDANVDDQQFSFAIHSSPHYLNYAGSYPSDLKYSHQYYIDPVQNRHRGYSRSTDQIPMYNYHNYPMDLSHSEQGLIKMGYGYPAKVNDQIPYDIDMELMQKEQRVLELEQEIELRKRQIEETIRYQEELLQLAELNNPAIQDYDNFYQQPNNEEIVEYDQIDDFYTRQQPENDSCYTYDNMSLYPCSQRQYTRYYDDMYQQVDPRESVVYEEPTFQSDHYYRTRQGSNRDLEIADLFDKQQLNARYPSSMHQRFEGPPKEQSTQCVAQDPQNGRKRTNRSSYTINSVRHQPEERNNIIENVEESVNTHTKKDQSSRPVTKISKRKKMAKMTKKYGFPTKRLLLIKDTKEKNLRGNGVGMRIIGGQLCADSHLGVFVEEIFSGSVADRLQGQIKEGDELIEWNGVPLIGKSFEDVISILKNDSDEVEILVRVGSISKSSEGSKSYSDKRQQNAMKSLTCLYDQINIREPADIPPTKKHPTFVDETSVPRSASSDRKSLSTKRENVHEPELPSDQVEPKKLPSPITERISPPSSKKDIDCGSPVIVKKELPVKTNNSVNEKVISKEILPTEADIEKEDEDTVKDESTNEKSLGSIQLILSFDDFDQSLTIHVAKAKHLLPMDLNGFSDPFVKIRLHPDPTEDSDFNRQTRYMPNTLYPEWQQTMVYMNILKRSLKKRVLEISVWDFDRLKANDFMGQTLISLANKQILDDKPHWYKLTDMKEVDIPGLRPARLGTDLKGNNKSKSDSKSSKESKNSKDERKHNS